MTAPDPDLSTAADPPDAAPAIEPVVPDPVVPDPVVRGAVTIVEGDNLAVAATLPSGSFTLVYLDPPFNTGRTQERQVVTARRTSTAPRESVPGVDPTSEPGDRAGAAGSDPRTSAEGTPETEVRHGFHGQERHHG